MNFCLNELTLEASVNWFSIVNNKKYCELNAEFSRFSIRNLIFFNKILTIHLNRWVSKNGRNNIFEALSVFYYFQAESIICYLDLPFDVIAQQDIAQQAVVLPKVAAKQQSAQENAVMRSYGFLPGEIVWAKMRGFPLWPARVSYFHICELCLIFDCIMREFDFRFQVLRRNTIWLTSFFMVTKPPLRYSRRLWSNLRLELQFLCPGKENF